MGSKVKMLLLSLILLFLLSGCSLMTLEELYCLPKRSEDYDNLQSLIDEAMEDLTYAAPISGENRQAGQLADLDGDGLDEYLLFAKDDSENPLKILIFSQVASGYVLMDTIEGYGFAFDFVDYAQMDDRDGLEIIVGRQVSGDLARSVSVYRFTSGFARQLLSTSYTGLACEDMDGNGMTELLLLTAGLSERSNGVATLYEFTDGELQRTNVTNLSLPISHFQQVEAGVLEDGTSAVFVTSAEGENRLIVDILAVTDSGLTNLSGGVQIPALRNYLVYPEDIDEDGILEIPSLVKIQSVQENAPAEYILQWHAVRRDGKKKVKAYTYHQHADGWYLFLEPAWVQSIAVERNEEGCVFYIRKSDADSMRELMTIFTLTGSDRESEAMVEGRIVLYKGDSIIYAVDLGEAALDYGITEESILETFRPIRKELNTEDSGE